MRTLGRAAPIPDEYRAARTPVVRVKVLRRSDFDPQEWYRRLASFCGYLGKVGKGGDEDPADYFGPGADDLDKFLAQAWKSPHVFQVIVSPDPDVSDRLDLQEFAESVMAQWQADLGVGLQWLGAIHRDTDEPHFQALLLGTTAGTGDPFRIAGPYISEGMRARAAEVQFWYLGDV